MNSDFYKKLNEISLQIYMGESVNLSTFNKDIIECVLSLRIIETDDFNDKTLEKYKYFDRYFILKVENNYYFVNTDAINISYINHISKIADYHVYQRKDKLNEIKKNINNKK